MSTPTFPTTSIRLINMYDENGGDADAFDAAVTKAAGKDFDKKFMHLLKGIM